MRRDPRPGHEHDRKAIAEAVTQLTAHLEAVDIGEVDLEHDRSGPLDHRGRQGLFPLDTLPELKAGP